MCARGRVGYVCTLLHVQHFSVPPRGRPEVPCNARSRVCARFLKRNFHTGKFCSNGASRGQPSGHRNTHMDVVVSEGAFDQLLSRNMWRRGRFLLSLKSGQTPSHVRSARPLARLAEEGTEPTTFPSCWLHAGLLQLHCHMAIAHDSSALLEPSHTFTSTSTGILAVLLLLCLLY